MSDTTNKHLGNVLSNLTDKDMKEVLEQYAKKNGVNIYKDNWEKILLNTLNWIVNAKEFDYKGDAIY